MVDQHELFATIQDSFEGDIEQFGLRIVQERVNNEPAVVVRLKNFNSGGIVFFADKMGYRDQVCDVMVPMLSAKFFELAKARGCFACGDYWYSELVATRFGNTRQISIKGKFESLFWNHQTSIWQGRHM